MARKDKKGLPDLRSTVVLMKSTNIPTDDGDIINTPIFVAECRAKLYPIKPLQYIGNNQVDLALADATHECIVRWRDHVDIFDTLCRDTYMADGETRVENFRVLNCMDMDNQRRFLLITLKLDTSL